MKTEKNRIVSFIALIVTFDAEKATNSKLIRPHLLRRYRISHLQKTYDFTPQEVTAFIGWSPQTSNSRFGIQTSSMVGTYTHLSSKDYLPKLCLTIN